MTFQIPSMFYSEVTIKRNRRTDRHALPTFLKVGGIKIGVCSSIHSYLFLLQNIACGYSLEPPR